MVTPTYLYTHLTVRLLTLDPTNVGFWVTIPKVTGEEFSVWHFLSTPFYVNGSLKQLPLVQEHVGLGLRSGKLISVDQCLYDNPILCPAPIEFDHDDCLMGILSSDVTLLSQCPLQSISDSPEVVRRIGNGDLLMYSLGETVQERCMDQPTKSTKLASGTYLISGKKGCILSSDKGWRYTALNLDSVNVTIAEIQTLPNVIINFQYGLPTARPDVPTLPSSQIQAVIERSHAALPDLARMNVIQHYNVVGGSAGLLGTVLVISVIMYILYRFYNPCNRCKKHNHNQPKEEPTAPLVTSNAPVDRVPESLGNVRMTRPLYPVEMLAKCPQPIVVSGITSETSTSNM